MYQIRVSAWDRSEPKATRTEVLKASPPMFESGLLDRFTRVHPAVPVLIYLPAILLLFATGVGRVTRKSVATPDRRPRPFGPSLNH